MERDSRDDGLILVNGKQIRRSLLRKTWTKLAKDCYKRGCNCYNCDLVPPLESLSKCRIKDYVMTYIKLGYYPRKD